MQDVYSRTPGSCGEKPEKKTNDLYNSYEFHSCIARNTSRIKSFLLNICKMQVSHQFQLMTHVQPNWIFSEPQQCTNKNKILPNYILETSIYCHYMCIKTISNDYNLHCLGCWWARSTPLVDWMWPTVHMSDSTVLTAKTHFMCEQHSSLEPLWKAHKRRQFTIQVLQLTDCLFLFTALLQLCILKNETVTVYTIPGKYHMLMSKSWLLNSDFISAFYYANHRELKPDPK